MTKYCSACGAECNDYKCGPCKRKVTRENYRKAIERMNAPTQKYDVNGNPIEVSDGQKKCD